MNKWIKYDDVVALLKAHAQDGDNLTLIGDETAEALENIPGIDIVLCKECKKAHLTRNGACKYCEEWKLNDGSYIWVYLDGEHFCSWGERKDDE